MKIQLRLFLVALVAISLPISERAWAQRNGSDGARNGQRGGNTQRDGQRDNRNNGSAERRPSQQPSDRGSGSPARRPPQQPGDRGSNPGQTIENRIRREVRDVIDTIDRSDRRTETDRRGDGVPSRDGRRDSDSGRTDRDRDGDYRRDRDRYDNRYRPGNRDNDRTSYRGPNGRYRYSPLVSTIIRQFPNASRILAPRGLRDRGAFYRNDGHYYYYPGPTVIGSGIRQTGSVYVDGGGTVPAAVAPSAYGAPVRVEFGAFVYAAELSNALPSIVNDLCLDMHYNYRTADNFDEAYRNAYLVLLTAKDIQAAQASNDRVALLAKLAIADELLHRVDEQTHSWVRRETRQIGELGMKTKLEVTSDLLHHLMYDVGMPIAGHPQAGSQHEFQR